ncbi:MAG: hypothetical protein GY755_18615 [Chloroflexi bacterium]|nr:hypothetical protein [Chloroflexota bacterium]
MKKKSRGIALLGIFLVFMALLAFTTPSSSSAFDADEYAAWKSFHDAETTAAIQELSEFSPPSPDQDPCLHCHISGQEIGEWTPLYRWLSFGMAGFIFLFGMTRSLSTWNRKEQWMPLGARFSDLVKTSDPLGKQLDKPAPQWQRTLWYSLGGAAMLFLLVQLISGIIGAFHINPFVFDPDTDTHASLILSIKATHWGLGILLLGTVLIFNFIGTLLNSEQRSYWVTMLIIGSVLGIPSIVQLTLAYLNPETTIIPISHLYALHIMLISALAPSVAAMYFIITHKESEE